MKVKDYYISIFMMTLLLMAGCGDPAQEEVNEPLAEPTPTTVPDFDAEAYFSGKTIQFIAGTAPGGSFDITARLYADAFSKHMPGNPSFEVTNLPGAGQLRGMQTAFTSPPDGLTVSIMHNRWAIRPLVLGEEVENWDIGRIIFVGVHQSPDVNGQVVGIDANVASDWSDVLALGRSITYGSLEPGGRPGPELLEIVGAPIQMVYGYGGVAETYAAFDRGEIDSFQLTGVALNTYPEWIEEDRVNPLFFNTAPPDADFLRRVGYDPDTQGPLPHVSELEGVEFSSDHLEALASVESGGITRMLFLPPDVPPHIVDVYNEAFEDTLQDPDFTERLALNLPEDVISPLRGEEIRAIYDSMGRMSPEAREIAKRLFGVE